LHNSAKDDNAAMHFLAKTLIKRTFLATGCNWTDSCWGVGDTQKSGLDQLPVSNYFVWRNKQWIRLWPSWLSPGPNPLLSYVLYDFITPSRV